MKSLWLDFNGIFHCCAIFGYKILTVYVLIQQLRHLDRNYFLENYKINMICIPVSFFTFLISPPSWLLILWCLATIRKQKCRGKLIRHNNKLEKLVKYSKIIIKWSLWCVTERGTLLYMFRCGIVLLQEKYWT